jgi:hypothetical protein
VLAVLALAFGGLWIEWARATLDARQPLGFAYSVFQAPFLLAFALAGFAGRDATRHSPTRGRSRLAETGDNVAGEAVPSGSETGALSVAAHAGHTLATR